MFNDRYGKSILRLLLTLLAVILIAGAAFAEDSGSETGTSFFAQFEGMDWEFSSGVGGWSAELQILPDGSFTGNYHDSEMGETGEGYPNGTLYLCSFTGRLSLSGQADDRTWRIRVDELKETDKRGEETVDDGIRYVITEPYGISEGDEMLLYRPGTSLDGFSDEMNMWAHVIGSGDDSPAELQTWFLYSVKNDSGFVSFPAEGGVSLANPWEDVTVDRLRQVSGMYFNVPDDAEKTAYRWYAGEKIAEIQFGWNGDEFCFRSQPLTPDEKGELPDISGMYFDWTKEIGISVGGCSGILSQAQSSTGSWVERCLWYDSAMGLTCSLSVIASDVDGLDLTAVAEQICLPPVG